MDQKEQKVQDKDVEQVILEAAQAEFIDNGFKGARMQKIADRAGVNKALLHYYYRSKSKLYTTVLENIFSLVWSKLKARFEEKPPNDVIHLIEIVVGSYIDAFSKNPDFPLFLNHELKSGNQYIPKAMNALLPGMKFMKEHLMSLTKKAIEKNQIREISVDQLLINMMTMTMGTFVIQPMLKFAMPKMDIDMNFNDEFYEERKNAIVDLVMYGLIKREKDKEWFS